MVNHKTRRKSEICGQDIGLSGIFSDLAPEASKHRKLSGARRKASGAIAFSSAGQINRKLICL